MAEKKKFTDGEKVPSDLITQLEAAELREVDLQVVNNWVRRGHVRSYEQYGKTLVSRSEVLSYIPASAGRPPKEKPESVTNSSKKKSRKK